MAAIGKVEPGAAAGNERVERRAKAAQPFQPDCAVRSAVARGDLDAARLSDYIKQARGH